MAAPRATQSIALRALSRCGTVSHHQVRSLHMTGPATYASPVISSTMQERPSVSDFAIESSKRRRIDNPPQPPQTRPFNTSRALKAVHDNSTIDFAFLPSPTLAQDPNAGIAPMVRVPILPTVNARTFTANIVPDAAEPPVMRPQISAMSADAIILPMAELSDGHGADIDFHAMAEALAQRVRQIKAPVEEQASIVRQIWNDLVDDVMGKREEVRTLKFSLS